MTYQAIPPTTAGGVPAWLSAASAFALSKIPTVTALPMSSENQDSLIYTLAVVGTGAATVLGSSNGGAIQLNSGATAGGQGKAINLNGGSKALVSNARTQKYVLYARTKIVAGVAGTGVIVLLNMTDEATADSYIGIRAATSTTNYTTLVGATIHDTGVAFDTTSYHDFYQVGDGTTITWYIDGVVVDTAAQSSSANAAGRLQILATNGDQNANAEINIDRFACFTEKP